MISIGGGGAFVTYFILYILPIKPVTWLLERYTFYFCAGAYIGLVPRPSYMYSIQEGPGTGMWPLTSKYPPTRLGSVQLSSFQGIVSSSKEQRRCEATLPLLCWRLAPHPP